MASRSSKIRAVSTSPSAASARRSFTPWRSVGQSHDARVLERSQHQATRLHLDDSAIRHPRADPYETRALVAHERHRGGWILGNIDDRDHLEGGIALGRLGGVVVRGARPYRRGEGDDHRSEEERSSVAQRTTRGDLPRFPAPPRLSITSPSPFFHQPIEPRVQGSCRQRVGAREALLGARFVVAILSRLFVIVSTPVCEIPDHRSDNDSSAEVE
jgi:hypothetical protein